MELMVCVRGGSMMTASRRGTKNIGRHAWVAALESYRECAESVPGLKDLCCSTTAKHRWGNIDDEDRKSVV